MKRIVLAFLLLLAAGCNAVSIEAREALPAETVWSFSVILPDAGGFDEAKVLLDDDTIISFYTYNGKIKFDNEDIDKTKVFSSTEPIGNRVYFLVSPMPEGEHTIKLEIDDDLRDNVTVDFFEIYSAEEKADIQSQINSLRGSVNSLVGEVSDLDSRLGNALTEEDKQSLQSGIDSVQGSLDALESEVESQAQESEQKTGVLLGDVQALNSRVNDLNTARGIGIGFFSLGSIQPETQFAIAILAIAVVAAILIIKFKDRLPKRSGIYGKRKQAPVSFSSHDEELAEQVLNESQEEIPKGKWAFGTEEPREKKRFNIGDLIRK